MTDTFPKRQKIVQPSRRQRLKLPLSNLFPQFALKDAVAQGDARTAQYFRRRRAHSGGGVMATGLMR